MRLGRIGVVIAELRSPDFTAVEGRLRRGCSLVLRVLCVTGLGLLPDMHAQAQMCSQYLKCPSGYLCKKTVLGAATGSCIKSGAAVPITKEKEPPASCETMITREVCAKAEHCNWPVITDACVTKCELRETDLDCQRPGMCLWSPQTSNCISRELLKVKPK